jgi:hypothetical protein
MKEHINRFLALHGVTPDKCGKIRCLWHDDKHPSMSLKEGNDNYHCFTCETNADIYKFAAYFYRLDEKRDFPEIKRRIEQELGLNPEIRPEIRIEANKPVATAIENVPYIYHESRLKSLGKAVFKTDIFAIESVYLYRNKQGLVEYVECRYPGACFPDGKKKVLSLWFDGGKIRAKDCPVRLYNRDLLASSPDLPVVIHEGAKCAEAAGVIKGFVHTAYNGGGKKSHCVDLSPLKGRAVYIYPDDDYDERAGMKTASSLKARLKLEYSIDALIVQPVPEARAFKSSGADIVEALRVKTPEELGEWILTHHSAKKARPYFVLDEGYELHEAAATAARYLLDRDNNIFTREKMILRPVNGKLQTVDTTQLRSMLSAVCTFIRCDKPCPPPLDITDAVAANAEQYFRPINELIRYPIITQSGRVIQNSGYDEETQCYFDIPPLIPIRSAKEARAILDDIFVDFPFKEKADKANLYAMLLTFIMRRAVKGNVPAFIAQAPMQGTGKSKLIATALGIILGDMPASTTLSRDGAEIQKTIGALILAGRPYFFFDNVKHKLDSDFIEMAITSKYIDFRLLGKNEIAQGENNFVFVFTSNNPTIEKDLARRLITINLDANREHPDDMRGVEYRHEDIEGYAIRNSARALSALLYIAQRRGIWTGQVKGSFEDWSRIVGGTLAASGIDCFLGNNEEFYNDVDEKESALYNFIDQWFTAYGTEPVIVKQLEEMALEAGVISSDTLKDKNRMLSAAIRRNMDRIISGHKILKHSNRAQNKTHYYLSNTAQCEKIEELR